MASYAVFQPEADALPVGPSNALMWAWEHRRAFAAGALIAAALLFLLPAPEASPAEARDDEAPLFI